MKRAGFTMIELIFVIVIIGILAAVALPKLVGVQDSARAAKAAELVSHLNSVVGPSLYAKVVNGDGKISTLYAGDTAGKDTWAYYLEFPTGMTAAATFAGCVAYDAGAGQTAILSDAANSLYIYCRDGNTTDMPRFWYSTKSTANTNTDFNTSKSSF